MPFIPALAGKRIYMRMRRRGFNGKLFTPTEEHFLDDVVLATLREQGSSCQVTFDDPDAVIVVETVGNRGGLAVWGREDLALHSYLCPD